MSWESFEEFSQSISDQPEGFDASRGPSLGGGHPGVQDMTPAQQAQHAASIAAEQAAQAAQAQDLVDQLSSIGFDLGGRNAAAAAAGYDPTGNYGGRGYQEGNWSTEGSELENLFEDMSVGAEYQSLGIPTPAGRTNTKGNLGELSDVFGVPNTTSLPNYDPEVFNVNKPQFDPKTNIFTNQAMRNQAAATAALNQVNKTPTSQLSGDAAQRAAYETMGYTPEMAAGWPAARNTFGDIITNALQYAVPFGHALQVAAPKTTAQVKGSIATAIDNLLGTNAPSRDPWDPDMDRETFVNLASDVPPTTEGYRGGEDWSGFEDTGGNVEAIRRFLQDPTYANIPEIDPISARAAYDNAIRGIDALVDERGFTGRGFAQAARDRAMNIFDEFEAGQDFDSMLNEKIGRAFADEALFNKDIELRGQGVEAVNQAFPQGFETDLFNPEEFSKAAENIYGQKLQGAQDVIARAGARGQLSPRGGRLASESLLSQGPDVQSRLDDILGGVRSEAGSGLDAIRGSALEAAQGYKLGDELFDVTPFTDQATDYLTTTAGELPGRVSEAVGTDPLFSAVSALQEGGRQQGMVSGTPSFLDVLAEREGTPGTGRDKRGLGSRGSGVF